MNRYLFGTIFMLFNQLTNGFQLKSMIKNSNEKGFDSIDDAKVTLAYYIQTLDEIKKETSQTDCLKLRLLHLPALRFYLNNIDKLNLDSVAASKSVKFTRQILSKYPQLVHKKLYRRLSAKLISKPIENLTGAIFRSSTNRTKEAYSHFLSRLKLKSVPNKQEHLEEDSSVVSHGSEDGEEFDLT